MLGDKGYIIEYFYAKIGQGNALAADFLNGVTPIDTPAIPIFFNASPSNREEFEKDGGAKEQGKNFFWCSDHPDRSRIIVINEGYIFIVKPIGPAIFWKSDRELGYATVNDYIKFLPVETICKRRLADVPGILASMTANAYYYTGTFRKITDPGNILAIQSILEIPLGRILLAKELLFCLSSVELETLVAKMFEEAGCFVPAYRGGAIKNIDIFAKNMGNSRVNIGQIFLHPGGKISIQVKRHTTLTEPPSGCDFLISAENDSGWILDVIASFTSTKQWLRESLSWLDPLILGQFKIL